MEDAKRMEDVIGGKRYLQQRANAKVNLVGVGDGHDGVTVSTARSRGWSKQSRDLEQTIDDSPEKAMASCNIPSILCLLLCSLLMFALVSIYFYYVQCLCSLHCARFVLNVRPFRSISDMRLNCFVSRVRF